jgi:hypothetical protein
LLNNGDSKKPRQEHNAQLRQISTQNMQYKRIRNFNPSVVPKIGEVQEGRTHYIFIKIKNKELANNFMLITTICDHGNQPLNTWNYVDTLQHLHFDKVIKCIGKENLKI